MTNTGTWLSESAIEALAKRIARPVVLVGMMGVGKSTVGRKLAGLLHLPFVDADEEIEKAAHMSVSEIFEKHGEAEFRDGERRVIGRLVNRGPAVIATGGGAFCNAETRALVLAEGIAVWLDCDTATLVERVGRKDTRPLLRNGDPAEILTRLKAEREPFYSQAPIHVMSEAGPHSQTVQRILQGIDRWL
ncbi:MAG: shikimate kinase [Novosphingobium sp.]|nr:shikimate kinase [Novosphingobium sp.]